jgi:succinyl-CoA synthetase alpha subunit
MIGPNCPGVLSPGKANVGIIPAEVFAAGSIGLVSRSGTLTYQIGYELAQLALGNSSIVGIGGDPVPGSTFVDVLDLFQADEETELIVLVGEIGGDEEEKAARPVAERISKPVVAYIAGSRRRPEDDGPRRRGSSPAARGPPSEEGGALRRSGSLSGRRRPEVAGIVAQFR